MAPMFGLATWLAASLASAGVAPSPPSPAATALEAPSPVADGGLVVFRDPVTGRPTSVPPEGVTFSQLSPSIAYEAPVQERRLANGAWVAEVPDYLHSYAVALPGADGRPVWTCIEGPAPLPPVVAPRVDAQGLEIE